MVDYYHQLIDLCWSKLEDRYNVKDYIFVGQVFDFICEMEEILDFKQLFTTEETKLLKMMIDDKPLLKLYKVDLADFILRLVGFASFTSFLGERAGISLLQLRNKLSGTEGGQRGSEIGVNKSSLRPKSASFFERTGLITPRKQQFSPPLSPVDMNIRDENFRRDRYKETKWKEKGIFSDSKKDFNTDSNRQAGSVHGLKNEIESLKAHIKILESQPKSSSTMQVKDLLNKISVKDKSIRNLKSLCDGYLKEIERLKKNDTQTDPIIKTLIENVNKQEYLIESLKSKLKIQEEQNLMHFMTNLPFLKQYYLFHKYRREQSSFGMIMINVVVLFLTSIMVLNLLKFIFYLFVWCTNTSNNSGWDYVYDRYSSKWNNANVASFSWWREIEWLEYLVCTINDW